MQPRVLCERSGILDMASRTMRRRSARARNEPQRRTSDGPENRPRPPAASARSSAARSSSNLRKYITQRRDDRQARARPRSPSRCPQIDIPHFRFGDKQQGGVGQGDGDVGDPLGAAARSSRAQGKAGERRGRAHPRGRRHARRAGRDPRRGAGAAAHRAQGQRARSSRRRIKLHRHPHAPAPSRCATSSAPIKQALQAADRARAPTTRRTRSSSRSARTSATARGRPSRCRSRNAVIIYMMDVSGSMGDEQKEIVRIEAFWIDTWLRRQYKGIETPLHHPRRRGAARSTATRSSTPASRGGTLISSAYKLCAQDHRRRLPADRVEHLPLPLLRRRQLVGRRHAPRASSC